MQLPAQTQEIYKYAMADTKSPSGSYTLNLDEVTGLWALDGGAFMDSDISGDIYLDTHIYIGDEFIFAGYAGAPSSSAYLEMWQDIQLNHIDWETWEYPPAGYKDLDELEQSLDTSLTDQENRKQRPRS